MEYLVKNELKDGKLDYEIKYKNVYIRLIVGEDLYKIAEQSIPFDLILGHIYSQLNNKENKAPKGLARELLCKLLLELIKKNVITNDSIILLEAEPSLKSNKGVRRKLRKKRKTIKKTIKNNNFIT